MREWTAFEEAERLAARFQGLNKRQFAIANKVPGGPSMLAQHIAGRRPISLEAALAYAQGLGVPLSAISPRLAKLVSKASATMPSSIQDDSNERINQLFTLPGEIDWAAWDGPEWPQHFVARLQDESMHPDSPSGSAFVFSVSGKPNPGWAVLVRDSFGRKFIRRYVELPDGWVAAPNNPSFLSISSRDGGEILACAICRMTGAI